MAAKKNKKKTNIRGLILFSAVVCIILGSLLLCVNAVKKHFNIDIIAAVAGNNGQISAASSDNTSDDADDEYYNSLDDDHKKYGDLADVKIRLIFEDSVEELDIHSISPWLELENNGRRYSYTVNNEKIREYTHSLAEKYNNYKPYIDFVSHYGENLSIHNNSTGWIFDEEHSAEMLRQFIDNCQSAEINLTAKTKESNKWWLRVAGDYDYEKKRGSCYAEVSIDAQYMWVYKNGEVILESPIVSGNPNYGNDTPVGFFYIYDKTSPARLYGPGYETEVSYWMAFIDDVGFHDATWQDYFGGDVYYTNGSHGCVNLPLYFAEDLYNTVYIYMPVYVY